MHKRSQLDQYAEQLQNCEEMDDEDIDGLHLDEEQIALANIMAEQDGN